MINQDIDLVNIFVNSHGANVLNEDDILLLNANLTEYEIHNALKMSNNKSAPGLDGLPCELYKVLWNNIKKPLLASFNFSFSCGSLSKSQRTGLICLHHKGKGLERGLLNNWRPISLTNTDYKLITKCFATRLNSCICKCIESNQFAFIKGRQIADLLREIDDVIEYGKVHFPQHIILSLDYAKAFDTLSVSAIKKALLFFGFGDTFIHWIDVIMSNRLSCVRNGGYISEVFDMERGVRQGCPISPLLFILTLELLARDIRQNAKVKGIKLASMTRPIKIKMYADDATLFLSDFIDFREVLSRIKLFSMFSGLCLNKNKCNAMFIGDPSQKGMVKCGIRFVNFVKILGISFSNEISAVNNKENFEPKINQLEKICSLWEKRHLTHIGKIAVLKTFGISQFIYLMQSIGVKDEYLIRINKIMFRFIWNTKVGNEKKVIEKVKRETMCSNYEDGGLNMIDISKMQDSFLLSWADKLMKEDDEPWKVFPLAFYNPIGGLSIFQSNVTGKKLRGLSLICNDFWKRVLITWLDYKNEEYVIDFSCLNINDPIFNNALIQYRHNTLFIHSCVKLNMLYIRDFLSDGSIMSLEEFAEVFGTTAETVIAHNIIFNALKKVEDILNTNVDYLNSSPILFRDAEAGSIHRKDYYNLIRHRQVKKIKQEWVEQFSLDINQASIWLLPHECTSEVKLIHLQWRILHDIYPTGTLLKKWKWEVSENCKFCGLRDSLIHFFAQCPLARRVWREASKIVSSKVGRVINFRDNDVLLGFLDDYPSDMTTRKFLNLVCLVGKHTISKFKYESTGDILLCFERELSIRNM